METTAIQESNRLIAEFMGFKNELIKYSDYNTDLVATIEEANYHTSWDWLMPVVEKCRENQLFGSQRLIDNIDKSLLKLDLLETYKNVVDFINWYNLQSK